MSTTFVFLTDPEHFKSRFKMFTYSKAANMELGAADITLKGKEVDQHILRSELTSVEFTRQPIPVWTYVIINLILIGLIAIVGIIKPQFSTGFQLTATFALLIIEIAALIGMYARKQSKKLFYMIFMASLFCYIIISYSSFASSIFTPLFMVIIFIVLVLSNALGLMIAYKTNWVHLVYGTDHKELYLADGSMFGWGGIFGGTARIFKDMKNGKTITPAKE